MQKFKLAHTLDKLLLNVSVLNLPPSGGTICQFLKNQKPGKAVILSLYAKEV